MKWVTGTPTASAISGSKTVWRLQVRAADPGDAPHLVGGHVRASMSDADVGGRVGCPEPLMVCGGHAPTDRPDRCVLRLQIRVTNARSV